ncbi:hypothetical protein Lsai_0265 [Legionella sainthelensi]|uniref:Uncharacterized protein n=1 Tax=Legionella sainthelensi TaxID=28087 RepID=A0A0W0YTB3_9GAMM|nr:hypothetical protein Lsai_0265 [Legionella sainthelensi]VEH32548.1 Uncharacterised protein [Legionella sainthelensi]
MRILFDHQERLKSDSLTSWNVITKKDFNEKIIKELVIPLLVRIVMLCVTTILVIQNLPISI